MRLDLNYFSSCTLANHGEVLCLWKKEAKDAFFFRKSKSE